MDYAIGKLEKHKDNILKAVIIIISLIISYNIYQFQDKQLGRLQESLKMNKKKLILLKGMKATQAELDAYKDLLIQSAGGSPITALNTFAKNSEVNVDSLRPEQSKRSENFKETAFSLNLSAKSYHSFAKFISMVESGPQIFIIESLTINSGFDTSEVLNTKKTINATLKVSNIISPEDKNEER